MAEEIQEAVQIIRVAYDGIEIAMKAGSGGIKAMQKIFEVLRGLLDYEKSLGKVNMRKLLMKGGDLQVLQFKSEDMKKVEKLAKKYGILYSVLPNINKEKGLSEIVFHSEAVPRVNMMLQKMKNGKVATFDEYLKEGNGEQMDKLTQFLEKEKQKGNLTGHTAQEEIVDNAIDNLLEKVGNFATEKQSVSVDSVKENFSVSQDQAENVINKLSIMGLLDQADRDGNHKVLMDKDSFNNRIRSYRGIADRMKAVSLSKNASMIDITISKTLIVEENPNAVKTRVPGTWGDNARYLWISKENTMEIHGGKTLLTFLDKDKEYKLYDESNHVVEKKKGDVLQSTHYDNVEIGVRQRYEKMKRDKAKREKQVEDALKKLAGEDKKSASALKAATMKPKSGKGKKR
ncbi:MAG: DUF3801 domain-containing protein [Eubacterium sp.]|nr:DUF3801 domain-containing protein [Eubacterium sp.]